jgi:hypothetical protein
MFKTIVFSRLVLSWVLGLGVTSIAIAATNAACSSEMASRSDSFLLRPNVSWRELSQHRSTEEACDDGYFAEGYSDLVVRLFAYKWDDFNEFVTVSKTRPVFYSWVIKHIDETVSPDDLAKVISNAKSCFTDPVLGRFCRDVYFAAEQAMSRINPK